MQASRLRHTCRLALLLAATAAAITAAASGSPVEGSTKAPCTGKPRSAYTHVVVIVMENHAYSKIIGSPDAPYENRLANACGVATSYYAITHPSLPNYIALTAGTTAGITDDRPPADHELTNSSIFSQLDSNWRSYEESMPSNCDLSSSGLYGVKHNPAPYFTNIRAACSKRDVPLPSSPSFSAAFTFVTPNLCNDMHDCPTTTGDRWLQGFVPKVLASPEYRRGKLVLFLTWDEGGGRNGINTVPLIVVAPTVPPGLQVSTKFTHYGLLRTVEQLLGRPCLASACTAKSLRKPFHL